jgi:hypothetical protein
MAGEGKAEAKAALGDRAVGAFPRAIAQPRACYGKAKETAVAATRLHGRGSRYDYGRTVPDSRTSESYDASRAGAAGTSSDHAGGDGRGGGSDPTGGGGPGGCSDHADDGGHNGRRRSRGDSAGSGVADSTGSDSGNDYGGNGDPDFDGLLRRETSFICAPTTDDRRR